MSSVLLFLSTIKHFFLFSHCKNSSKFPSGYTSLNKFTKFFFELDLIIKLSVANKTYLYSLINDKNNFSSKTLFPDRELPFTHNILLCIT